jgi:hypothetical protein
MELASHIIAGFWLFAHDLGTHAQSYFHALNFVVLQKKEVLRVKPPEPVLKQAQIPIVQAPDFKIEATPIRATAR